MVDWKKRMKTKEYLKAKRVLEDEIKRLEELFGKRKDKLKRLEAASIFVINIKTIRC